MSDAGFIIPIFAGIGIYTTFKWLKHLYKDRYQSGGVIEGPRDPAPCGDDKEHYFWKEQGWACPRCAAIRDAKKARDKELAAEAKEEARMVRFAKLIAEEMRKP